MKIIKFLLAILFSIAVASCGGGGGGGSSPSAASALSGVAAVGYPIVNGTVQIKCAGGSTLTTTTNSTGAWQVTISGQTLPCAVQVSGGTINSVTNTTPYQSIAASFGTVNVTPFTDLIVANILGTATPNVWFAGLTPSAIASITPTVINAAIINLNFALSGLTPLSTINPITLSFTPTSGNTVDDMLTAMSLAMTNTGISYATMLGYASNVNFIVPANFGIALTSAYISTPSGGAGSGGGGSGTGSGTGVTFSGTLGTFSSIPDSNWDPSASTSHPGGFSAIPGDIVWSNAAGVAMLSYLSTYDYIYFVIPSASVAGSYTYGFHCGVSASGTIANSITYPSCSSIGITFNRTAGMITFASTPILNLGSGWPGTSTGITGTGSLTFQPF